MEDGAVVTKRVREECEGGRSGTDEDNQTSENNKTVGEQARNIFDDVNRKNKE